MGNRPPGKKAPGKRFGYAELHAASSFSFLEAASDPEALVARAAELGLPSVALVDRNGVYGAPRFYRAARRAGIRPLVGAEVCLTGPKDGLGNGLVGNGATFGGPLFGGSRPGGPAPRGPRGLVPEKEPEVPNPGADRPRRLTLLVESRAGYKNLCRLLTAAARGREKGDARADWDLIAAHAEGLHCLTGGGEGPVAQRLEAAGPAGGSEGARRLLERLAAVFPGRLHVELQRHQLREEELRNQALIDLAASLRLPLVATGGVRHARRRDKPLLDVLTCIREHTTLERAGRRLLPCRERHLKAPEEMARLFADQPGAVAASLELADRLAFTLDDLGYRFPDYPLPPGETPASYLRQITWSAATARFRPLTARAQAQVEKELAVIEKLDLAGYFLIVWDIVRFCRREGILAQGRGSAANSAVCYALGITAVDPVKMGLLFERFLSEERGEWPDIDLDLPSGDQREKVIQYVYERYGPHGAAMTATVITYRDRSATREVAKALGYSEPQVEALAKRLGNFGYDVRRGDEKSFDEEVAAAGFDPGERRMKIFAHLWERIHDLPRHLGQHTGGMIVAAGRLDEVVPLEPASMPGRTVIQWDKDDCADLGLVKVDLLGLGMLNALEEAVPLVHLKERVNLDLAHLPPDDPKTFEMIRKADTVGVFQIESRAQMATLPRHRPEVFYDLVVQVAIIRPGPIVGGMVHPFFDRKRGREPVTYPHPSLEPVLARTLGVPLFQEQILRMAMVAAGFTGGEGEELRRAMGFKRPREAMDSLVERLRSGMAERGITGEAQEQILQSITSFALYGFPESHAASFALIAYASAYLKAHHPTAFYVSLLNAWPMGFYHPSTLIHDARRHGVDVRPIDLHRSGWRCRWEELDSREGGTPPREGQAAGALRLGMRFVKGLKQKTGERIEVEAGRAPFKSPSDLIDRCGLREAELTALAEAGALGAFGLSRREALWQVGWAMRQAGPLFADQPSSASPLPEMSDIELTVADFLATGLTVGPHPLRYFRPALREMGAVPAAALERMAPGAQVKIAGSVIVRQRPGTAKGMLFLTLEDETGMAQAIVTPDQLDEHRTLLVGAAGLVVEGTLQKFDGTVSVKAAAFHPLPDVSPSKSQPADLARVPSHDFR